MYRKLTAIILSLSILIGIMPIINLSVKAETERPRDIDGNEWRYTVFSQYEDLRTKFDGKIKFFFQWSYFLSRGSELKDDKYPIVDSLTDILIAPGSSGTDNNGNKIVIKYVSFERYYDQMWTMEYYDTTENADRYKICLSDGVTYLKDNTGSLPSSGGDMTVTQDKDQATAWDLKAYSKGSSYYFGHDITYTDPHFKINEETSNGTTRYSLDLTRDDTYPTYYVYVEMPWITTKFLKEDGSEYKQDSRQLGSFGAPQGPDKTGYTFIGWTETQGSSEISYKAGDTVTPTASETYYPVYTPNNYTVRFYPDSTLSGSYVEQSFVYDASQNLLANDFSKIGSTFNCWVKSDDDTITYQDCEEVKNLTAESNGIVNLYAAWNENSYTVEYSANYGKPTPESKTVIYSEKFTLPDETAVTRDGYTLVGWNFMHDGSGEGYAPGLSVSKLTAEADGEIKLYAIWKEKHTHTPGDWETTIKPTCSAEGEKIRRCTDCNFIVEVESIDALEHKPGTSTTKIPATCTAEGLKTVCCEYCGVVLSEETIQKKDHTPGTPTTVITATCTAEGLKTVCCENCGVVLSEETIQKKDHTPGDWETSKAATCTAEGEKVRRCTDCNIIVEVDSIDPLGHKESEVAVTNKEATCTAEGEKLYFCERCGVTLKTEVIPKTEHVPGKWEIIKEPTCTQSGLKQQCCAICGALLGEPVEIEPHDHNPGAWKTVLAPDCEHEGEKVKSCTVCGGAIETEAISALGHTEGVWVTAVEPTCDTEGQQIKVCTRCGKTIESKPIEALGHTEGVWVTAVEPTCDTEGQQIKVCTRCGETIESEPIEALGHTDGVWVTVVEPTCVTEGQQIKNCTRCGETIGSEPIEALGHTPGLERTCVTDQVCVVCGAVLAYADGVSHVWSEWATYKSAGFFTEEEQVRRCSACGEEEYRFVKGTAGCHKYCPHSDDGENCEACDTLGRVNSFFRNVAKTVVYLVFGNAVVNLLFPTLVLHFHEWFDIH